jgi:hypothetical protein
MIPPLHPSLSSHVPYLELQQSKIYCSEKLTILPVLIAFKDSVAAAAEKVQQDPHSP